MGLKDVWGGDHWYAPLGKKSYGGGAYVGRGKDQKDAEEKEKARANASKVAQARGNIAKCRKCKKLSKKDQRDGVTCGGHAKDLKIITKYS